MVIRGIMRKKLISRLKGEMRSEEVVGKLSRTFSVLGDPTRTRVIFVLSKHELCVAEIASLLDMSHSAISHQLRSLRDLDLVRCRKEGRRSYYSLIDSHIENLFNEGLAHVLEKIS